LKNSYLKRTVNNTVEGNWRRNHVWTLWAALGLCRERTNCSRDDIGSNKSAIFELKSDRRVNVAINIFYTSCVLSTVTLPLLYLQIRGEAWNDKKLELNKATSGSGRNKPARWIVTILATPDTFTVAVLNLPLSLMCLRGTQILQYLLARKIEVVDVKPSTGWLIFASRRIHRILLPCNQITIQLKLIYKAKWCSLSVLLNARQFVSLNAAFALPSVGGLRQLVVNPQKQC
uniref:G-protein coupled receptors family 1 profile domain-containing protein n=1 Tax=Parascaris equorum TaxID=6256 RepID=A0A914RAH3_PAREQ